MPDSDEQPTLALETRIQLSGSGDSLRRWFRLRRLWDRLPPLQGGSAGELEKLRAALEEGFDEAAKDAAELAALLEENAEEIDAVLAAGYTGERQPAGARSVAAGLRELPGMRTRELESLRGEGKQPVPAIGATALCTIIEYLEEEARWECIEGVEGACTEAAIYALEHSAAGC